MGGPGRRRFLLGASAWCIVPVVCAQRPMRRIGIVFNVVSLADVQGDKPAEPVMREFLAGLREHGWREGENLRVERRSAEGDLGRLEGLVRELAEQQVEVIVTAGNAATLAARRATVTVPIVSTGMVNPVESGLATSFARPGGNVTGSVGEFGTVLQQKRLELLHELLPDARRVAFLYTKATQGPPLPETVAAAKALGMMLAHIDAPGADIEVAFRLVEQERPDALLVAYTVPLYGYFRRVVAFAARARLPDVYGIEEAVEAGGLASYGPDVSDTWRRTARYVARVLDGAKPSELPIERSDRYRMVLSRQRARTLGVALPLTLQQRADRVIE